MVFIEGGNSVGFLDLINDLVVIFVEVKDFILEIFCYDYGCNELCICVWGKDF